MVDKKETLLASNIFDFRSKYETLKARIDITELFMRISIVQNCHEAEWVEVRVNEFYTYETLGQKPYAVTVFSSPRRLKPGIRENTRRIL